ncbi:MAG: hypothetical protein BWZ02_02621 [Lentisphaerae bacterium ADurb.BinA184]|nr:MAG: hypothetical protein BWZ02_02621 [Lentisphaerae bacterium ADurb.BinA184]
MTAPAPTLDDRFHAYLAGLAVRDWGAPAGFAGRTCFQAIPPLELERRGEPAGVFRPEWIHHSLDLLRQRKDCQDFAMVGLLRLLLRYPQSSLFTLPMRAQVETALLNAKYDVHDPGDDSCCWHTENHQVQYAASELLLGQRFPDTVFANSAKRGCWHRERAREKLYLWLDWRLRFSFSEWNSSCYYDEDAAALLNLAEYAEDAELRRRARDVLNLLLFDVALNSWRGTSGASQGRAYFEQQVAPSETPMATLARLCWEDGPPSARLGLAAVLLAAGDVRPAPAVLAAGRACPDELESRARHGLDAEEGAGFGVYPDRLRDHAFYMGAGQGSHPLVCETRFAFHNGEGKWPGFFADREYYNRCRAQGVAFDTWALPHALGHADLYTFRTPEYMLGCAQDYHPGAPGYQQFIWCATLGPRAVVFTTNPAPPDIPYGRPGPWVGNGVLPKVVQHRNVLIALYRVRPCPIYDQPPWHREDRVHAWFPRGAFDEVVERAGWCFGRTGGGYVALRPDKPAEWLPPDPRLAAVAGAGQPYEWSVRDTDVAWVCELGARQTHGSFEAFVDRIAAARVEGGVERIVYDSPSLGRVEAGWQGGLSVAGRRIAIHDYPRFDNAYCQAPFGVRTIVVRCGGHEEVLGEGRPESEQAGSAGAWLATGPAQPRG